MTDAVVLFVRVAAGLACVAVLAAPALLGLWHKAGDWLASSPVESPAQAAGPSLADMRLVLDLAARLKSAGCTDGVALCQQLLEVMLGTSAKAKK